MSRSDRPAREVSWTFRVVAAVVIVLVRVARWRILTEGLHHVPARGGAIITWNHTGHVDFVTCAYPVFRGLGRPIRFLAKRELWASPWTRAVVRGVRAVPVDRDSGRGRAQSLASAVAALRDGELVGVAPEGTLSTSFELLPFRAGAVRMAREAGVPVVPCVSWGSHRMTSAAHGFSLRRAFRVPVVVRFGDPIHVAPDDDVREVTARLRARTESLLHEAQAGYPDGAPAGAWWVPARLGGGAPPPPARSPSWSSVERPSTPPNHP